jgi:hypothetical protein
MAEDTIIWEEGADEMVLDLEGTDRVPPDELEPSMTIEIDVSQYHGLDLEE